MKPKPNKRKLCFYREIDSSLSRHQTDFFVKKVEVSTSLLSLFISENFLSGNKNQRRAFFVELELTFSKTDDPFF